MTDQEYQAFYTDPQLCDRWHCTSMTLYRWRRDGILGAAINPGGGKNLTSAVRCGGSSRPASDIRILNPKLIGKRLRLTNEERVRYGALQLLPCDMTNDELAEWRKSKDRHRAWQKRRQKGMIERENYEANAKALKAEAAALGVSYETLRKRKQRAAKKAVPSPSEIYSLVLGQTWDTSTELNRLGPPRRELSLVSSIAPYVVPDGEVKRSQPASDGGRIVTEEERVAALASAAAATAKRGGGSHGH